MADLLDLRKLFHGVTAAEGAANMAKGMELLRTSPPSDKPREGTADIVAFLEARLAEEEAGANVAIQGTWEVLELDGELSIRADQSAVHRPRTEFQHVSEHVYDRADADHIARWDPTRVLAEIAAKREIVRDYQIVLANNAIEKANGGDAVMIAARDLIAKSLRMVLRRLAAPFADHPDYDPVWAIA